MANIISVKEAKKRICLFWQTTLLPLPELITTLAIVGLLAVVFIPTEKGAREKSSKTISAKQEKLSVTLEWSEGVSVTQEGNKLMLELEHRDE